MRRNIGKLDYVGEKEMKKLVFTIALILTAAMSTSPASASQITSVATKKFSNCAALNRVYPGGVAKSSGVRNRGGRTNLSPRVSAKVYAENKSKDRDHDGIACER